MTEAVNPYAAPAARVEDVGDSTAEAIRRAHLRHEASIKTAGLLYYFGGVLTLLPGIGFLLSQDAVGVLIAVLLLAFAVGQFFAGWGVRGLRDWGRIVGSMVSIVGLLAFPVGTLINGYFLYLFQSKKGRTIFSSEYQAVVAATPHVKYGTSIIVWIFLALVVGLIVFAFTGPAIIK